VVKLARRPEKLERSGPGRHYSGGDTTNLGEPDDVRRDGTVVRGLCTIFDAGTVTGLTDGQLLERFTTRQGKPAEMAFAAIVERHGPMVLRVCRSHARDYHDAQDAFQATFLVLVRKARSLWVRDSLGPWLHRVAQRLADRARRDALCRKAPEFGAVKDLAAQQIDMPDGELAPLLHEEIDRLPERYRVPLVLCELEGRTHEEAARHLGCPVGTVKSRLSRGRDRLRDRLQRRGLAPVLTGAMSWISAETARAAVPAALKQATTALALIGGAGGSVPGAFPATVAALTEGVCRTMFLTKVKLVAAGLTVAIAATGAGVLAQQESGGRGSANRDSVIATVSETINRPSDRSPDTEIAQRDPGADKPERRSDSERIAELERKLELLMRALDDQKRLAIPFPPTVPVGAAYPQRGGSLTPAAIAGYKPGATTLPAPAVVGQQGPTLLDVLKLLEAIDRKLDRALESRGPRAEPSALDSAR
jgi:RNA polymerase sigma factor (sigma-70 family)